MEDRIGKLPDDVLGVLISHLTLEEAARTSVLSRRWKNSWTLTTHLNFDAKKRSRLKRGKFVRWVNQVVENCRASDLDEFSIVSNLDAKSYHNLDEWICFAVRKRVKAININLCPTKSTRSKLYSFIRSAPDLSGIEYLTSLSLKFVNITGEMIECLLSICPLLEKLSLERSKDLSNLRVVGSSLKLKCFRIDSCFGLESVEIYSPNLVSFYYYGRELGLQVQDLSCLVNLSIGSGKSCMDSLFNPFSGYYFQLETLTLDFPSYRGFLEWVGLTQLTNLKHLTLELKQNAQYTLRVLSQFINLCPLLHKLTLKIRRWSYVRPGEMMKDNQCPHQCLKVVEIIGFYGRSDHSELAMFILENAIRLEKFIINLCSYPEQSLIDELRRRAEQLRTEVPPGVELLIFEGFEN